MARFLIDTSAFIESLLGTDAGKAIADFAGSDVALSEITCYELTRNRPEHAKYFSQYETLPFDSRCRNESAKLYFHLRRSGRMVSEFDVLIAGCARANAMTVLTLDKAFSYTGVPCRIFRPIP